MTNQLHAHFVEIKLKFYWIYTFYKIERKPIGVYLKIVIMNL